MRISDWSSDVCSSDLIKLVVGAQAGEVGQTVRHAKKSRDGRYVPNLVIAETVLAQHDAVSLLHRLRLLRNLHGKVEHGSLRSEERRVGQEGVSTCRSRWSPNH